MVLRNMDPANGVCNGTRGILTRMNTHVVEIRLLGGENAGQKIFLPKVKLSPSDALLPFPLQRIQFPLRLAFSMTINKSQGQSVKHVGLDLRSPVFTHGQFYVAVSRATSVHRIHAIWDPKSEQPWTKNIVYPQVLLD
jgi:ATP-dependent exoDNAse (exonuclease V) alpha subunit